MASRGRIRTACEYMPTVLEQRPSGLHRGSAHYPPVRGEGRERHALSNRNRRPANAFARESDERKRRAESRGIRRHPVLVLTTQREGRESGSPSTIQITIGDYGNGHLRNRDRQDNQST